MPRNGSGAYVAPAGQPVVSGTAISSTVHNALITDIGNELTKSICTDGQTPMTANLPMGSNRITGLAAGVSPGDATRLDQVQTIADAYLPRTGGTMTGNQIFNNNLGIFMKDSGATTRQVLTLASDNNVNMTVAGGLNFNVYNQAGTTLLWSMNNAGVVNQRFNLVFENGSTIASKDAGSVTRDLLYMAGNTVVMRVAGAASIEYYNQAGSTLLASLTYSGTFSAVTLTATSDERLKGNWKEAPTDLVHQIAKLQKVGSFTWKGQHAEIGDGIGAGAQSLEAIWPAFVDTGEDGYKKVQYGPAAMVTAASACRYIVEMEARFDERLRKLEAK